MHNLKIESLVYGGAGLARADGKAVFIDNVVDGDVVEAEIYSDKKSFAMGSLSKVLEPSEFRIEPLCKMAKICGGCQWQHVDYEHQLDVKTQIVKETLEKALKREIEVQRTIASPNNLNYRCKVQMPVAQKLKSKRILAGYFKKKSHELVNIKYCPIQPCIIGEISEYLKEALETKAFRAYDERTKKGMIRHFVFRYSITDNKVLLILVLNSNRTAPDLKDIAFDIMRKFPVISGVCANFNKTDSNVIMGSDFECIAGQDYIEENLEGRKYRISKGSFFQVNPLSAVNIFRTVEEMTKSEFKQLKPEVLDVYSGVGSFSIWLKDVASKIVAVEDYAQAIEDARVNLELNNAKNIELLQGDAQVVLDNLVNSSKTFDVVILDPPRKGCSQGAIDAVSKLSSKNIIYVSCNPATLARDLKSLEDLGFNLKKVQPVDMFCHTHHVETVVLLEKSSL